MNIKYIYIYVYIWSTENTSKVHGCDSIYRDKSRWVVASEGILWRNWEWLLISICGFFFFYYLFKLGYSCFTILYYFLLYNEANQLTCIHIFLLSITPLLPTCLPSTPLGHRTLSWAPWATFTVGFQQLLYIWWCVTRQSQSPVFWYGCIFTKDSMLMFHKIRIHSSSSPLTQVYTAQLISSMLTQFCDHHKQF